MRDNKERMKLVLASASPRRKELLEQIGLAFEIDVCNLAEMTTKKNPEEVVKDLSYQKARNVFENGHDREVVIGADTVVSIDNEILGKPADREEAFSMIHKLQGRIHQVYTGVTILWKQEQTVKVLTIAEKTEVEVYEMSRREIECYVETGEPMDKAGGYGIQGGFAAYVKAIHGDYNNVVGLPVARLYQELKNYRLIDKE